MKARLFIIAGSIIFLMCQKTGAIDPVYCWKCVTTTTTYPPPSQAQVAMTDTDPEVLNCNMTKDQIDTYIKSRYLYKPQTYDVGASYRTATCKVRQ
jgi:hypothetical protein